MNAPSCKSITEWLIDGARSRQPSGEMMARDLRAAGRAGLPLSRVGIFIRTLHPDIFGRNFVWRQGGDSWSAPPITRSWIRRIPRSPLSIVFDEGREIRRRMDDPDSTASRFFDDMRAEGVTDYIALPMHFIDGSVHASSWTTKQPGGFTDEHLEALRNRSRRCRG